MVFQHEEAETTGDDAGLLSCDTLEDFRFGGENIVGSEYVWFVAHHRQVILRRVAQLQAETHRTLEIAPPAMFLALEALDGFDAQVVFLLQRLDDGFVVERNAEPGGQLLADGAATAAQFAVDGDDEFFCSIHGNWINRVKITLFFYCFSGVCF